MEYNSDLTTDRFNRSNSDNEVSSSVTPINPAELFQDGYELSNSIITTEEFKGSFTPDLNNIEFYIVNIDILTNNEREGKYRFFTLCGRIIYSYYGKIFFQLSIPPLYTQYNTHIPIKLKGVGKLGWRNNEVIIEKGMSTIEVLKYSNLFNAFSRPLP